jgi:acyl-CoA synthetase (NDP forming)
VRFHEYIEFLAQDDKTEVIMLYLESIKQGDEIVRVCKRAARKKPVIALKVGRSSAGQRASASHTGALAVSDAIVEDAFRQAGIHRVNNADEMFDLAEAFLDNPHAQGQAGLHPERRRRRQLGGGGQCRALGAGGAGA